ncbi:MAG: hypothetical protein FD137_577 [Spirochaetes bacterium]|nr:MAG: hypothetical protein FD137_577 [Spirochaetota bacterium]
MDLAGVSSVYLFGDSVGRGIILDADGKYSPFSESFAPAAAKKLGIALLNKARFGCTIGKGLDILKRCLARGEEGPALSIPTPQVAILEFGGAPPPPATPLDAFGVAYKAAIQELKARQIIPLAMTLPPLDPERYYRWFTKAGLDGAAILKWLGNIQNIFLWHEGYDKEVRRVATASGTAIIDIRQAFLATPDYRLYLCEDGIHPNKEGHRLMEKTILDFAGGKFAVGGVAADAYTV